MRLYYEIIPLDYIMEFYHGIKAQDFITKLYDGTILRNYITELYYGIISQDYPYEKDPGAPQGVPGAPWDLRGFPWHALGTPRTRPGPPGDPPGTPTNHKNNQILTNLQRQQLLIGASESFRCNASPQGLPWTAWSCIPREWVPFWSPECST